MRQAFRSCTLLLNSSIFLVGQCPHDPVLEAVKHNLAWRWYWMEENVPKNDIIGLQIAKDGKCTGVAIQGLQLAAYSCETESGTTFQFATCYRGAPHCLLSREIGENAVAKAIKCNISVSDITRWQPSPAGKEKDRILYQILKLAYPPAAASGKVLSLVAGDFNLQDRDAFAYAVLRTPEGSTDELLIYLVFHPEDPAAPVARSRMEYSSNIRKGIVKKLTTNAINLMSLRER